MGAKIYGVFFYCFTIASFLGYLLQFYLTQFIGFQGLFWLMGGFSAISLIIMRLFKEECLWSSQLLKEELGNADAIGIYNDSRWSCSLEFVVN